MKPSTSNLVFLLCALTVCRVTITSESERKKESKAGDFLTLPVINEDSRFSSIEPAGTPRSEASAESGTGTPKSSISVSITINKPAQVGDKSRDSRFRFESSDEKGFRFTPQELKNLVSLLPQNTRESIRQLSDPKKEVTCVDEAAPANPAQVVLTIPAISKEQTAHNLAEQKPRQRCSLLHCLYYCCGMRK